MSKDLKQAIKREYLKCADNPVHFMKKYCTIQHPKKGKIKFFTLSVKFLILRKNINDKKTKKIDKYPK